MTVKEQRKLDRKNKRRALHIRNKVRYANEGAKGSQGYSSNTNGAKGAEGAKGLEASNPTINRGKYKFDWINHRFDTVNGKHYNSGYARAIINGGAFKGYESLEEYDERQRNNESPKPAEQETQQQPKPQDKGTPAYDPAPSRKWAEALRHAAELKKDGEFDELKKYLADFGRGYYQRCLKDYSNWGSGEAFKAVTGQSFDIEKEGEKAFYAFVSGAVKKMMLMSPEELEKHADELDKDYQTRFAASKKEARVPYSPKSSKRWSAILRLCATHAEDGDMKELRNILSSLGGSYYKRCLNNREEWGVGEAFKVITGKEFEYDGRNKEDFRDYINSALSKILKSSADDLNRYADKLDADYKMRTQGLIEEPMGGAADSDDYSQGAVADDWDDEEDATAPVEDNNPVAVPEEQEQTEPQETVEPTLSEDAPVIEDETPVEEESQEPAVEPETVEEEPPVEENKETSKPEPNDKWGEYYQFIDDTSKEALFQSGRSAGFGVDPRLAFDVEAIAKDKSLAETALELNIKGLHKYDVQDEVVADLKGLFWEHSGKSQYFSAKTYWKALIQAGLYQIVDGQIKMTGLGKLITSLRAGNPIATKARTIATLNFLTNNRQLFAAAVIASQPGNDGFAAYCKEHKITGNRYTALRNALSLYTLFSRAGILEQGILWNTRGLITNGFFSNVEVGIDARQCAVYVAAKYLKELNKAGAAPDNPSITLNTPFCNDIFEQIIKISGADNSGLTTGSYERNEDGSAQFVSFISESNFRNFAQQLNKDQWANSGVRGVVDGDDVSLQFDNISDLDERFAKTFIGIDDYGLESLRSFIDRARGHETGRSKQEQTEEQVDPTAEEPNEEQAQEDAPVIGEETAPEDEPVVSEEVAPEDEPPVEEQEEVAKDNPEALDEPIEEQDAAIEDSETEPVEEVDDNAPTIEDEIPMGDQANWAKDQTNWAEEQQEPVVEPEPAEELEGETDDLEETSDDDSSEEQSQYLHDVQDSVYELARLIGASQMFNHEEGRERIIDLLQGVYDKGQDSYYKKFYDLFLKDKGDASTIFGILDGDEGEGARDNLVEQVESSIADALKDNPDASLEELLGIDNSQVESEEDEVVSEEQEEPLDAPSIDEPVAEPPVDETAPSSEESTPYAEVQKNIADLIERHKGNPSYTAYLNQLKDGLQQAIDADDEDSANDIVDEVSELLNEGEEETSEVEPQDAPVINNELTKESDITFFIETERAELKNPQIAAMKDEAAQNLPADAFEREFTAEEFDKQYGEDGMTPDGAMLPFRVYDKFDDVSSLMRFVMAYRDSFDDLTLFNEKFKTVLDFYRVANQIGIDTDAADKALVKAYEAARDIQEQWHKTIEDRASNGANGVDEPEKEDPGVAVMEETSEAESQDAPVVSGEPVAEAVSENTNKEPTADAEQENADAPVIDEPKQNKPKPVVKPAEKPKVEEPKETLRQKQIREAKGVRYSEQNTFKPESFGEQLELKKAAKNIAQWGLDPDIQLNMVAHSAKELRSLYGLMNMMGLYKGAPTAFYGIGAEEKFGELFDGKEHDAPFKTSLLTRLQSTDDDVKEYAKAEVVVNLMNQLPAARYLSLELMDISRISKNELIADFMQKYGLNKAAATRNADELIAISTIATANGIPLPFSFSKGNFTYRDIFSAKEENRLGTGKLLIAEMKYWSQFKADGEVYTLLRYLEGEHSPFRKYTRWNKGNTVEYGDLQRWFSGLRAKYHFISTTFTNGNDEVEFKGREFDKANPFGSVDAAPSERQEQESDEQSDEPPVVSQESDEQPVDNAVEEPQDEVTENEDAPTIDAPVVEEPQEMKPIEQDKEETVNPEDVSNPLKSGTWKKLYSRLKDSDINSWDNSSPSDPTDAAIAQQYRDDFRTFSQHDAKALYKKHFDSLALSLAQASRYPLRDIAKFISNDHELNAKKKEWDAAFFVRWMYDKRRERLRFALKRKGVDFKSDPTYKAIDKEARAAKKHYSLVHGDFTKLAASKLSAVTKNNTPESPGLYSHEDGKMNPIWTDREIESALPQVATGWDRDRDEERNEEIHAEEARKPEYDIDRQLNETRLPKEVEDSLTDDQLTISSFPGMRRKLIDYVILKNGGLSLKARKEIASGRLSLNDYLKDCVEHGNLLSSDDADRLFLRFSDNVTTPRNPGLASAVATKTASDIYSSDSFLKGMKERGSESYEFFKNINDSIDEAVRGHLGDLDDSQEQVLRDNTRNIVARVIESYLRENVASFWCRDKKENVSSHKNAQAPILILRPQDALAAFKSELDKMTATDPDFLKNILKGKQEETQDYKALETEIGINADLRGSEKQVNWANGIRHRFASDMSRFIKTGEPGLYDKRKIGKTILKEFAEWHKDGLYDDDEYKKIEEIVSAIDTSPETRKKFILKTVARLSRDGMTTATWWIDNDKKGRNPKGFNISSNFINSLMRVVSDYARESLYSMDDKENHFVDRSIKENSLPPIKGGTSQQRSYAEGIRQRALGAYNGYIETGLYPRGFNQIWLNDGNIASDLRSSIKHLLMNKNGKDPDDTVAEPVMKVAWEIFKETRRSKTKRQEYVAKTFDSYTNKGRSDASLWIDADTTDYLGEPSKGQVVNSFFESMLYRIAEDALKQIPLKQEKESLAKAPNETPITPEEVSNPTSPGTWQKIYDAVKDRPFEYLTGHSDDKLHQSITEEFGEDIKRFASEDETDRRTDWFNSVVSDCMEETEYYYRSPKGKSATLHDGIVALSKFPVMFEKKNAVVMSDFLKEAFTRRRDERREEVKLAGGNVRTDAVYKMLNKIVLTAQEKNEEAIEDFKRMATRALSWDLDDNSEENRNQVPQQMLYMKPRRRQINYDRYMEECEDAAMAIGNSL